MLCPFLLQWVIRIGCFDNQRGRRVRGTIGEKSPRAGRTRDTGRGARSTVSSVALIRPPMTAIAAEPGAAPRRRSSSKPKAETGHGRSSQRSCVMAACQAAPGPRGGPSLRRSSM